MIRMSEDEHVAYRKRLANLVSSRLQTAASRVPGQQVKKARKDTRNKYGAEKTNVDGQVFDSKAEAKRYMQLKLLQAAGEITGLETQVCIALLPAQQVGGRKERPVNYFADFQYVRQGVLITEDVKSAPTKTKEFILKRKMALFFHGIVVVEVMVD